MFRQRPARQLVGAALWCRWSTYTPSGMVSPIHYSGYFKMKVKLKTTFICSIWHNSLFVFRQLFGLMASWANYYRYSPNGFMVQWLHTWSHGLMSQLLYSPNGFMVQWLHGHMASWANYYRYSPNGFMVQWLHTWSHGLMSQLLYSPNGFMVQWLHGHMAS